MGKQSRLLEVLPNLILFLLFICCMFTVLLTGAKIYRTVSDVMEEQFSVTTCVNYISAKIRHYDVPNGVLVGIIDDSESLILQEEIDGEKYMTYLYCKDGNLMELFCAADADITGDGGESIMPLDALNISTEGSLISFSCESEGEIASGSIALQCGKVGDPS